MFVRFVASRVMRRAAVKDIAAAVAAGILGNALLVREAENAYDQWSLSVVFGDTGGKFFRRFFLALRNHLGQDLT